MIGPTPITSVTVASGGGSVVDNGNGTFTYTPAPDYNGPITFNYTASDGSLTQRVRRLGGLPANASAGELNGSCLPAQAASTKSSRRTVRRAAAVRAGGGRFDRILATRRAARADPAVVFR